MSVSVNFNGVTYSIPETGDTNWGAAVTSWIQAVSTGTLSKSGGSFVLTAELDFGGSFGLKALYFKSRTANPAQTGALRLAYADALKFRNTANSADLALAPTATDNVPSWNGVNLVNVSDAQTLSGKSLDSSVNTITGLTNATISASAAIALTKLAALGVSKLLVSDASGVISVSSVSSTEAGYLSGVTSAIQTQINTNSTNIASNTSAIALKADIASPTLTGTPAAPTAGAGTSTTQIATTAFVTTADNLKANLASPALTGTPTAPTAAPGTNTTQLATTAYADAIAALKQPLDSDLTAIAALSATGLAVQTAVGSWSNRTIVGTANQVDVTNGNGVSGNPTLTMSANPVIPGTDSVTLPIGTTAQRGTGVNGKLRYNSDNGAFEGYAAGAWGAIAGAGGGGTNYIAASDGASIGSWVTYADAAGTSPVDGVGGSPASTFAVSADTSLVGASNFLFTKSAANRQGEGFSYPFSIDPGFQAKPLTLSFLYKIASGTYADNDISVWVYDVTNSVLIPCTPMSIKTSGVVEFFKTEFQSAYNSTSYRVIFHIASTSALAFTLRFDAFSVAPTSYAYGGSVSEDKLVSLVPSASFGTTTLQSSWLGKIADKAEVRGYFKCGTTTASAAAIGLPSGYVIDSAKFSTSNSAQMVGWWHTMLTSGTTGVAAVSRGAIFYDGTDTSNLYLSIATGSDVLAKSTASAIFNTGDGVTYFFTVPIRGWGSTQVQSTDTDTRQVLLSVSGNAPSAGTNAIIIFPTTDYDTHGGYNSTTGQYTVKVSGAHRVSTYQNTTAGIVYSVYKNGSSYKEFGYSGAGVSCQSVVVPAIAGDLLDIRGSATNDPGATSWMQIERLQGNTQISASEKVIAIYSTTPAASTSTSLPVQWNTRVKDTHGTVTTGASWRFTAPRSDVYLVCPAFYTNAGTGVRLYKNGTVFATVGTVSGSDGGTSIMVELLKDEYIDIRTTSAVSTFADALNTISIAAIGR